MGNDSSHKLIIGVSVSVVVNRAASCGLTEDRDTIRIAAEKVNIGMNPFDSETLIEEGWIRRWEGGTSGEPENGKPIASD